MELLALTPKRTPRKDLAAGIGASVLVHLLAFSTAFIWALVMPHKSLKPPYCTVNLVSLKDLGTGSSEPKGSPKAAEDTDIPKDPAVAGKARQKSEPVVPIKRLTVDEAAIKPESQIKKIEPKEVPVAPEKPQSLEAIEKNLDKLIATPKMVPHTSRALAQQSEPQPKAQAQSPPASARNQPGNEKVMRGTPAGSAEGGAKGAVQGSSFGSPDGSGTVSAAEQAYYARVRDAITQEFKLPDQNIGNLETGASIVVGRDGKVLSFQIEKPSGNSLLDAAAVRAIQNANIPPIPQAIDRSKQGFRLKFGPRGVS